MEGGHYENATLDEDRAWIWKMSKLLKSREREGNFAKTKKLHSPKSEEETVNTQVLTGQNE